MSKIRNIIFCIVAILCLIESVTFAIGNEADPVYGSWNQVFVDSFDGDPTPYNSDPNFDAGLISSGWQFSSAPDVAFSTKRTGDGRVQLICNPGKTGWLMTNQYFSCETPTEFFTKQCEADRLTLLFKRVRLTDSTGNYQISANFRRTDKLLQVFVTEAGVEQMIFQGVTGYTNVPSISIVVSKETIDVYLNRTNRVDLNGGTVAGYSYHHNIPESVISAGFQLQLFAKGDASVQTVVHYDGVVVSRRPLPDSIVDVNVTSQIIKSGLDANDYCATNWEAMASRPHLREIFDNTDRYNEFIAFLSSEYPIKTFRYPGGLDVGWLHFGVPYSSLSTAVQKPGAGYTTSYDNWINIEEFFQFLVDSNSQCILQVNTWSWFDSAANEIKWLNDDGSGNPGGTLNTTALAAAADAVEDMAQWIVSHNYQSRVRYWEMGNEDYFVYGDGQAIQYATVASVMINKVKGVLPDAKIIITNQIGPDGSERAWRNTWSASVNQNLVALGQANNITGVTHHNYNFAIQDPFYSSDAPAYQEFAAYTSFWPNDPSRQVGTYLDSSNNTTTLIGKHLDILATSGLGNAKLFWTEFRYGGMVEKFSKAIAGGLGTLHLDASLLAATGVNSIAIHGGLFHANYVSEVQSMPFESWGFNSIYYQADAGVSPRFVSSPLSEIQKIISKMADGDVLQSSASHSRILSVATKQGDILRVLVINEYAKPNHTTDTSTTLWSSIVSNEMIGLASDSSSGDTFNLRLALPAGFDVAAHVIKAYKFSEMDRLESDSVNGSHYEHHEIKLQEEFVDSNGTMVEYALMPSSAVLFEFVPATCAMIEHLPSDLNQDCHVDLEDLAEFVSDWMKCNKPNEDNCIITW